MSTHSKPSLADKGQAFGLRLIARAGGLEAMKNPVLRSKVERILYKSAQQGFKAQTAAGKAFARKSGSGSAIRPERSTARREFDLTPSEDQAMIQEAARELADEVIRPAGGQADTDRAVPDEVRRQAASMGLTLVGVPTDLGGVAEEASAVTSALVIEELARGDMGLAVAIMSSAAVANALVNYGDSAQQATFLPPFTDEDDPATGALAMTEPQPLFDPLRPRTLARTDGDDVVIDGQKSLVVAAASADLFIVSALLDDEPRLIVVQPGTAGLTTTDDPAMGLRAAATGRLHLDGVRVPAGNVLGTSADVLDAVRRARLAWAAAAVGTGQAVVDHLTTYTVERTAFGEPIAQRQAVAFTVADAAIEVDALRLVVWRAAAQLDAGRDAGASVAHARSLTSTYLTRVGSDGVQLLGGHGFVKEYDNERWYRDLRGAGVLEGTLLV
ncbi:acyl-CoA dehydrogenase family protein [Allobranchiibius sp. GilTou73]|uniref:acyl-CoA dehydrogenase family protein n=1 Tax=Allobranchiibius sp. GilTou73 TaxID=2904523 RepID=UPI001F1F02D8|nr:acyl-CoA dehydrogenase family protein [Allobranchiibius sp. GilTou73]UIJ34380.1 acyl-CoA dehydrogenase family protein [Allobranchiibius sp. GilTou73]